MSKFQQLRAKALSLRGAIAVGGALVMAVGMVQATGTLAAPDAERHAKAGIATQNFFPTPLTEWVTCTTTGSGAVWNKRSRIDWAPVAGATGYQVDLVNDSTGDVDSRVVPADTTRISNVVAPRPGINAQGLLIRVRTINGDAVSSGYRTALQKAQAKDISTSRTECEGSSGPSILNADWENQYDWDTGIIPFATTLSPSIFGALFDGDADVLGDLPEGDELTSLDEATVDATPTTSEKTDSSPSSTRTSQETSSSPSQSSQSSTTATSSDTTSVRETATDPSTPVSAITSSPTPLTTSATTTPSSVQSMPSSSPIPTATSTTARASVWAKVSDHPIVVGASQARLEEVDDQTRLIVTRSGSEVCAADVDGASRIESSDGLLNVTVSGRTRSVDLKTCELT